MQTGNVSQSTLPDHRKRWGVWSGARFAVVLAVVAQPLVGPILVDRVETAAVLIAYRRFAQFPRNERQRTQFGQEKGCCYDHDYTLAGSAPLSTAPTTLLRKYSSGFVIREIPRERSLQPNAPPANSFRRLCRAESLSAQSVRF